MTLKTILAAAASLGALTISAQAQAACADLMSLDLEDGTVTSAMIVTAGGFEAPASGFGPPPGVAASPFADVPAFCRV